MSVALWGSLVARGAPLRVVFALHFHLIRITFLFSLVGLRGHLSLLEIVLVFPGGLSKWRCRFGSPIAKAKTILLFPTELAFWAFWMPGLPSHSLLVLPEGRLYARPVLEKNWKGTGLLIDAFCQFENGNMAFSTKIKGNHHLQGNVQVHNVRIPEAIAKKHANLPQN